MPSTNKEPLEGLTNTVIVFIWRTYFLRNKIFEVKILTKKEKYIVKSFSDTHKKAVKRVNCPFSCRLKLS